MKKTTLYLSGELRRSLFRLSVLLRKENGRYRSVLGGSRVSPVPARQWVLSLPFALRYRLAYDAEMVTAVRKLQQFTGCWRWRGN